MSTVENIPLRDLRPDPRNPRFLDADQGSMTGDALFVHIAEQFDPLEIAESIALHDYFQSEVLIAVRDGSEHVVLEGNRRLTAMTGLAREDLRSSFPDQARWHDAAAAAASVTLDTTVPVLVVNEREDADAVIGYRHIAGIERWKPFQQARFIAHLVDDRNQSFSVVADTVGEPIANVKMLYRNQRLINEAREIAGLSHLAAGAQNEFGKFTTALNRTALRAFVGATTPSDVVERERQLAADHVEAWAELGTWVFGRGPHREGKVVKESRALTQLAAVVRDDHALVELRETGDLENAFALTPGPPARVLRQFRTAIGNLRGVERSLEYINGSDDAEVLAKELRDFADKFYEVLVSE